jgi:hypothetical protein
MSRTLELLQAEWRLVSRVHEGLNESDLVTEVASAAAELSEIPELPRDEKGRLSPADQVLASKRIFAQSAAEYSWLLFRFVTGQGEATKLKEMDDAALEETARLLDQTIPSLKQEARRLRAEIAELEGKTRERGIDPAAITPQVDWAKTVLIDPATPPVIRYVERSSLVLRLRNLIGRIGRRAEK